MKLNPSQQMTQIQLKMASCRYRCTKCLESRMQMPSDAFPNSKQAPQMQAQIAFWWQTKAEPVSEIVHWPTGQFTGQLSTLPHLEHYCHVWVDFFPSLESVLPNLVGGSQLDNVDWTLSGQFQALPRGLHTGTQVCGVGGISPSRIGPLWPSLSPSR